jgi:anti-anti-sigma factor
LSGRFTFSDHGTFRTMIGEMEGTGASRHVIDLSGIEFIDSAGLGMLLLARDEGKRKNLDVALRKPTGQVKRMLEVARFDTMFTIED